MLVVYEMKKKAGKEKVGKVELAVPDRILRKLTKQTVNKEQLLLLSLVDTLARIQGYDSGRILTFEEVDSA